MAFRTCSPQPYPSGSIPPSSSAAFASSSPSSDGSNSTCHATGISRPPNSVPDMAVRRIGDHRSSSHAPSPSASALPRFFGTFQVGILATGDLTAAGTLGQNSIARPDRRYGAAGGAQAGTATFSAHTASPLPPSRIPAG